ncbi:MAG: hypothetical protein IK078_05665, partial [Lachnospiraceae bacterium]|nr:hypothetical protein [Lachnospiraceae bacterium]
MEMSEFYDQLTTLLQEKIPDDTTMQLNHVRKNNGVIEDGISFTAKGKNISPNIYLAQYLAMYENGRTMESIAAEIAKVVSDTSKDAEFEVDDFVDFEKAKKRIVYKLINMEKNSKLLEEIPYKQFMDLAMVFYYILPDKIMKDTYATILIHRSHLQIWKVTEEELEQIALINTPKLLPPDIVGMAEVLKGLLGDAAGLKDIPE